MLTTLCAVALDVGVADADVLQTGSTLVVLRADGLRANGVEARWGAVEAADGTDTQHLLEMLPGSTVAWGAGRALSGLDVRHDGRLALRGPGGSIALDGFVLHIEQGGERAFVADRAGQGALALADLRIAVDAASGSLLVEGTLVLTPRAAKRLGLSADADRTIGILTTRAIAPQAAEGTGVERASGATCGGSPGADVIVGHLPQVSSFGSVGGIAAFSIGTVSCNVGSEQLLWVYNENHHPVIAQNMYRLKNGRFEQIGMSWLKHGFAALTGDICGCGYADPGTTQRLGVGCSDPYQSGLNGNQFYLGPRSEVNPHTGEFPYPFTDINTTGDAIYKRLQVHVSDLDPGQDGGGIYFAEGQYVTPDDASAGNGDNNASYRQVGITGSGANWTATFSGMPTTVRAQAAIHAWRASDPSVVETDVRVPEEGLVILAARAESLGGGMWHYEYAVQNLNSERAVRELSVPLPAGAVVQNIGFHDVDYHSGEPFDGTDWPGAVTGGGVRWATATYQANPNANALRWGSLYNFRFDANQPPAATTVTFALFKPGKPGAGDTVPAPTIGPAGAVLDCNSNGVPDAADVAGGVSQDCNANGLPDECEDFPAVRLAAVEVAAGLDTPIAAGAAPGDATRLFICEQNTGRVRVVKNGVLLAAPFLDLGGAISSGGERGLLGIAFHPNYASNGYFFVAYTNVGGDTVIARYTVSADADLANAGSALVIRTVPQDGATRNGGQLVFGADGNLYVGLGDGGAAGDALNRAQDVNSLLGKILRLDVDAAPPYVPADNPYVGQTGLDEIWALGLHDPHGVAFDRLTGEMYVGDRGDTSREEIDVASAGAAGANFGWRCYEGSQPFNLSGCGPAGDYVFPLHEYPQSDGACGVVGGYVYRGCALPQLRGTYFFADRCAGWVRSFRHVAGDASPPQVQDRTFELGLMNASVVAFAEGADGELYLLTAAGKLYRIENADAISAASVCGNNVIEYGEQCDDGNTSFGDGCDERCQLETAGMDVCGGAALLCPGTSVMGSTVGAVSDGSATCGDAAGSPAHWYEYRPVGDGAATFQTCGSDFDTVVSVHTSCPGGVGTELACSDDGCSDDTAGSRAVVAVHAGQSYWVRVAGYDGAVGTYTLSVDGPACTAVCGNDVVEIGEECEPPGENGCSAACTFNVCEHDLYVEDFDAGAPAGWSLNASGSTAGAGAWVVGDPDGTNTGGDYVQPENAASGAGCAFTATNASLTDGDVDGGVTYLVSPAFDLSGLDNAKVRYTRWFYNGTLGDDAGDYFIAQVSDDDGGSWTTLETVNDNTQANAWTEAAFELSPLVALTN
ncbi:MAG TPA: PQQ-dependent sugar dehydrogenase, partial [Phycisphaerae bacterium]|nr:PQQ-dependent sugar dehydrogenase [Phycisphaerae bacterium]